ncbi:MAG: proline--tRNA ligase [Bdellovibrionales bacterium]|nr:proline--tRNA ligase [Bdellovibrionales bacterium]
MRISKSFFATLRDNPRDADVVSQQLMLRSGMLRKHAAGIYSYLPLMVKSYHKLCQIVREELDNIGWQEVIMPFVIPAELWQESGRWQLYGKELARLKDRKNADFCLGPTHEEVVTDIVRSQVTSHKQLPVTLYQITAKFRDEVRPRFGIMRGREFTMMDGYSFHTDSADLDRHYEEISAAYCRIFDRAGLKYVRVEADTGAIGGSGSHEFHVLAESGEDLILFSDEAKYAANMEKAETPPPELQAPSHWGPATTQSMSKVATPNEKTIEQVGKLLNIPAHRSLKTLVYRFLDATTNEWKPVIIYTLGHRQLNEVKLNVELTRRGHSLLALGAMPLADVEKLFGCPVGFLGPIGAPKEVLQLFDREIRGAHDAVMGANEAGFHLQHVEPLRDLPMMTKENTLDIVNAMEGDICPRGNNQSRYQMKRGIEVGHIFKLGNKYSKAMNAAFQNDAKESKIIEMGCYGIGITRVIASAIEQNNDKDGIVWPTPIAPYQVHLVSAGADDPEIRKAADGLYDMLRAKGVDVLYDDRELSPGVKFKDADLLGIPKRVVVGKKGLAEGMLEVADRRTKTPQKVPYSATSVDALLPLVL